MPHDRNVKNDQSDEKIDPQPPLLDGTVSLEDGNEDKPPRIKGLVELIQQYYSESRNSKS